MNKKQLCPMTYNVPPERSDELNYDCIKSLCAWWVEDAQKCAMLVLAETQRKAVKQK